MRSRAGLSGGIHRVGSVLSPREQTPLSWPSLLEPRLGRDLAGIGDRPGRFGKPSQRAVARMGFPDVGRLGLEFPQIAGAVKVV